MRSGRSSATSNRRGASPATPLPEFRSRGLSEHTINCYLRSIRAFWSWLLSEGIADKNPFEKVKVPGVSRKVASTFSDRQLEALLGAIDTLTPVGYRDYTIILTLPDTALLEVSQPLPSGASKYKLGFCVPHHGRQANDQGSHRKADSSLW